ncbi:ankyrin repeat domain-containing protein 34B-like [Centruroides sculpturatus]|uniref:ankyrin repeat domain-containing protein 34B-like n=1 Tax=Centruroides sculpturatus TaxID=218467 RepID=UPI000C6DDEA1|nr:ankyrin repeat domain-containing protein 34B-like [Centruroides sculpturatus]
MHLSIVQPPASGKNPETGIVAFNEPMNNFLEGRTTAQFSLFEAIKYRRYRQAKLLVEAGVNVDSRNEKGETPLICTSLQLEDAKIRIKFARLFVDAGANPNLQDNRGLTALMYAAIQDQPDLVLILLECKSIDTSIQDPDGNTALIYAALHGYDDILAVFINTSHHFGLHLNLEQKNNEGRNALETAEEAGHENCVELLRKDTKTPLVLQEIVIEDYVSISSPVSEDKPVSQPENSEINLPKLEQTPDPPRLELEGKEIEKPKSKTRILPLLSLQHVGEVGKSFTAGDSWEWDLGSSTRRKSQRYKYRPLDTGSRSLSESRGKLSDSWDTIKFFKSSEQISRDTRTTASMDNEIFRPPNTEILLPPIGSRVSARKKTPYLTVPDNPVNEEGELNFNGEKLTTSA